MSREKLLRDENNLGGRFGEIRKKKNLTQQAFAQSIGIGQGYLSEIEKGLKEPSTTIIIAVVYRWKINEGWLKTGAGPMFLEDIEDIKEGNKKAINLKDLPKEEIKTWLDEFWEKADDKEKAWLEVEMRKKFPEFAEWLTIKRVSENGAAS
ncbi:MAG: helix-turn-helix transcriptional regulator [Nitrospinae bacterium]|nr:helix-turn-helix transcriptional regulator [Nitrospinota bacterium]